MKRSLLLVAVLAALFAALFALGPRLFSSAEKGAHVALRPAEAAGDGASLAAGEGAALVQPAAAAADDAPEATRTQVDEDASAELASALWIEGRVAWPEGCQADAELEVVALSAAREYDDFAREMDGEADARKGWLARRPVEPDGSFRIPIKEPGASVHLIARGRLLYAAETREVRPDASTGVVLALQAGACIAGTLAAPGEVEPGELSGVEVDLDTELGSIEPSRVANRTMMRLEVHTDDAGRFELRALPAGAAYSLHVAPETFAMQRVKVPALGACETRGVTVTLERGGRVTGVVRDETGQPVDGAEVAGLIGGQFFGFDDREVREAKTGAEGRFELAAVPVGAISVRAKKDGYLESKKVPVEVPEAGTAADVVVELPAGNTVSGRVAWQGGGPVAKATVSASFDMAHVGGMGAFNMMRGASGKAQTGADGSFTMRGLGGGPFIVSCAAPPPGAEAGPGEDGGGDGEPPAGKDWHRAKQRSVAPGTEDLLLVLAPPAGLWGRVAVADGEPPASFTVRLAQKLEASMIAVDIDERSEPFEAEDGSFFLASVDPGEWHASAKAPGWVTLEPTPITMPAETEHDPLVLELVRTATIAGTVVTPDGQAVANASVHVKRTGENEVMAAMREQKEDTKAEADEQGRFRIEGVPPHPSSAFAESDRFARGAEVSLDLSPGALVEDVELRLSLGGRLTGEVYGSDGEPAAGRMIIVQNPGTMYQRMSSSAADGTFEIERLVPGTYQVIAMQTENDWTGGGESPDMSAMMDSMKFSQATIVEGETTHVVLGAPPADPVRVFGEVTHGGRPYAGALISFYPEGESIFENMKFTTVGEDGTYEVTLDGPGGYVASVARMSGLPGQQSTVEYSEEIPQAEEYELDFEIPDGGIAGTVHGPDGAPAAGARVTLTAAEASSESLWGGQYSEIQTDENGAYEIEGLRPGTYRLAVGGAPFIMLGSGDVKTGRVTRDGVHVGEDEWVRGVDFRLPRPGSAEIKTVDAAGAPLPGATVFARNSDGRVIEAFSLVQTDGSGTFLYRGLAPGEYTFLARGGGLTSVESAPVRVREGETAKVRLQLGGGVFVCVQLKGAESEDLRGTLRVVDDEGREVSAMIGMEDIQALYMQGGFSPTEHRLGPLPPGRYKVFATFPDGETATRSVLLRAGDEEKRLTVRLRE